MQKIVGATDMIPTIDLVSGPTITVVGADLIDTMIDQLHAIAQGRVEERRPSFLRVQIPGESGETVKIFICLHGVDLKDSALQRWVIRGVFSAEHRQLLRQSGYHFEAELTYDRRGGCRGVLRSVKDR